MMMMSAADVSSSSSSHAADASDRTKEDSYYNSMYYVLTRMRGERWRKINDQHDAFFGIEDKRTARKETVGDVIIL